MSASNTRPRPGSVAPLSRTLALCCAAFRYGESPRLLTRRSGARHAGAPEEVRPVLEHAVPGMSANPVVGATQAAGHEAGWAAGQREGMAQGREEGYRNGFEAGREDGYLQGLKEGRADGQLEAQAMARLTVDDRLRHLDQLLAALPAEMIKRLHQSEDEMAALCFEVICRIVGDAVKDPHAVRGMVRRAVQLASTQLVAIHVHPADLAGLQGDAELNAWLARQRAQEGSPVQWVADDRVELGDACCVRLAATWMPGSKRNWRPCARSCAAARPKCRRLRHDAPCAPATAFGAMPGGAGTAYRHGSPLVGACHRRAGADCQRGELCAIQPTGTGADPVLAEVVGIEGVQVVLMPFGGIEGLAAGNEVVALGSRTEFRVGDALLGRVIDAFGQPLDGLPLPALTETRTLKSPPLNPMQRPRIHAVLETGIRSIDALLTLGRGQRVGIFAGSGVGKSTLLGMIARHVDAEVNVIALIGERGREVREFIDKQLGPDGLKRSVVVVATADQPALARVRAVHAALAVAEYFRDKGVQVVLTMDSITRFAMARREIGLAAGEPPTARGYTPSVFSELPELCERCGTAPSGGSITALLTVLVEGDDLNEPISDALRAILDGHIVLSRQIAHQGQYPAIDILKSASRLLPDLATREERELGSKAVEILAMLERNRQMVELGAYEHGTNPELDRALDCAPRLKAWLNQANGGAGRSEALRQLADAVSPTGAG